MASVHGKHTYVSVGGTDISDYTNSAELSVGTDTHDITAFGNDSKAYAAGLRDATFSVEGWYDSSSTRTIFVGAQEGNVAVAIVHRPEGTGSSLPQNAFSGILTSYAESASVDDMVMWSAEFQVTGDIDTTAQSA